VPPDTSKVAFGAERTWRPYLIVLLAMRGHKVDAAISASAEWPQFTKGGVRGRN